MQLHPDLRPDPAAHSTGFLQMTDKLIKYSKVPPYELE